MDFSIVIPTYNRAKHLNNCLLSLLIQTKKPFEILVIDNSDNLDAKKIIDNLENKFKMTNINILIYAWSMLGRVIYNIIRILMRHPKNIKLIPHCLYAPIYVLLNFSKIKKGNLNFFNKTLT